MRLIMNKGDGLKTYCVYMWSRLDLTPLYVGAGIGHRRYRQGINGSHNNELAAVMKESGGSLPFTILKEWLTRTEAEALEVEWIARIGREDLGTGPLINHTNGGRGVAGLSAESLEKIAHGNRGKKISEEQIVRYRTTMASRSEAEKESTRLKQRLAKLGKKQSVESVEKRAASLRGRKRPDVGEKIRIQRIAKFADPVRGAAHKAALTGRWITNGEENRRLPADQPVPAGWGYGRSGDYAAKISKTLIQRARDRSPKE